MNDVAGAIGGIVEKGYQNMVHREGDEVREDGLLYCGVCGRKKERFVTFFNKKTIKVPCSCQCDEIAYYEAQKASEEEARKNMVRRMKLSSMIDVKYNDATFDKFEVNDDNLQILKYCKRYVEAFPIFKEKNQGLLFYGDVGTGKSFASACIANELMERGTTVLMTSFARILSIVRQGSEEERNILNQITSSSLVIFDDFGAERDTEYAMEKIFDILDQRYRSKLPMIITTNISFAEMKNEQDMRYRRLYDRIFEVCYPIEFKLSGKSWRKIKANDRFAEMRDLLKGEG